MNYGISNVHGKTDRSEVKKILQYAYNHQIDIIDTAALYGNSENVIGDSIDCNHDWKIITKTPNFLNAHIDDSCVKKLRDSFENSLINLNMKRVYGLLIHSCDDLLKSGGDRLFKEMKSLQSIGLVGKIGVSVYSDNQIEAVLNRFDIDLIQLPINILDQNLLVNGWLKKIKKKGIEIHARSVFLQGLLLMPRHDVPVYFSPIYDNIDTFISCAHELSLSCSELSLGFVQNIKEIDKIIVGVNTVEQLRASVEIEAKHIDINIAKFRTISVNNPSFTNPSLWKI